MHVHLVSHVTMLCLSIVKAVGQNGKQLPILHLYRQSKTYFVLSDRFYGPTPPVFSGKQKKKCFAQNWRTALYFIQAMTTHLLFLSLSFLSLHQSKKRFEREWREAERAAQYAEKTDQDINATKADVEKVTSGEKINIISAVLQKKYHRIICNWLICLLCLWL